MADGVHDQPPEKYEVTARGAESAVLVTQEGEAGIIMGESADGGGVDGGGRQA